MAWKNRKRSIVLSCRVDPGTASTIASLSRQTGYSDSQITKLILQIGIAFVNGLPTNAQTVKDLIDAATDRETLRVQTLAKDRVLMNAENAARRKLEPKKAGDVSK